MGNNPTKSQSLHELFPSHRLLPELTTSPSNHYQFIFVGRGRDVFIIKESSSPPPAQQHPNTIGLLELKHLDSAYYGLYEWMPYSLENLCKTNPGLLNRESAIDFLGKCVRTYADLWRGENQFLDIRAENIKAFLRENQVGIKVLQPSLTHTSSQHAFKNRISDLGFVMRQILIGKNEYQHCYLQKKYGKDVEDYVHQLIGTKVTNHQAWEQVQQALGTLTQPKRYQHIYDNQQTSIRLSNVSVHTPTNHTHSYSPYHERRASISPARVSNFDRYTSQHPQPLHMHQDYSRSPQPRSPLNRTESKVNFNTSENSEHSFHSHRELTPKKQEPYPQIVSSRILSTRNRSPAKFATENPSMKINNPKVLVFQKPIDTPPMFMPSTKDQAAMGWQNGVPSPNYTLKMKEDKNYILDEEVDKVQQSENRKNKSIPLIENLLLNKKKREEAVAEESKHLKSNKSLSVSEIGNEKEESFGLELSEDEELNYEGTYEGSYHPLHPEVKHGQGRLVFSSGGSYLGHFNWNKMDGWGKLFYPSGRLAYEGYWKEGKFEGYGKLFNESALHLESHDYSDFNRIQLPN